LATANKENFTPERAAYLLLKTCEALNHLHSQKVYNGNVHPDHIFVTEDFKVKFGNFLNAMKVPGENPATPNPNTKMHGANPCYSCPNVYTKYTK
jgi:serine/threonine protein kinase